MPCDDVMRPELVIQLPLGSCLQWMRQPYACRGDIVEHGLSLSPTIQFLLGVRLSLRLMETFKFWSKSFVFRLQLNMQSPLWGRMKGVNYVCRSFQDEIFPGHIATQVIPVSTATS